MPSPKVILNAFLLVTVKVLNSYYFIKKGLQIRIFFFFFADPFSDT